MKQRHIHGNLRPVLPRLVLLVLILATAVAMYGFGCNNEGDGSPGDHRTGTIEIDGTPDHLNVPWGLVDGDWIGHWEGNGDRIFTDMRPMRYTIAWEQLPGYTMQGASEETLDLFADSTVVFVQVYVAD